VSGRLLAAIVAAVVLAVGVVGGILFVREEDPPTDYDAGIEDDFMATCTEDADAAGFAQPTDYCRCTYDRVREQIAFDRFLEIDADLAVDPDAVPGPLDRIRTACYLEIEVGGSAPTDPPSTTAPA
jgi:hypothetical protein